MKKYYCDRCAMELTQDTVYSLTIRCSDPFTIGYVSYQHYHTWERELCRECCNKINDFIFLPKALSEEERVKKSRECITKSGETICEMVKKFHEMKDAESEQ